MANKRKIISSALIGLGAFFLFSVLMLSWQDQYADFGDPKLHVAGSLLTISGQVIAMPSIAAIAVGVKVRKSKAITANSWRPFSQ